MIKHTKGKKNKQKNPKLLWKDLKRGADFKKQKHTFMLVSKKKNHYRVMIVPVLFMEFHWTKQNKFLFLSFKNKNIIETIIWGSLLIVV